VAAGSEVDLVDLQSGLAFGKTVKEIAEFLARQSDEVRQKMTKLSLNAGHDSSSGTSAR
jgi:hypothetical protein